MLAVLPFVLFFASFGERRGKNCVYVTCRIWSFVWYCLIFVRHRKIYLSPRHASRPCIFVANHTTYLDIPQALLATRGSVRMVGRHDLGKTPVFGAVYRAAVILVNRGSNYSKAKSMLAMKKALDAGSSVFLFPEGSFNETNNALKPFYDGAFSLSLKTGVPVKPIVFPDTVRRLHYSTVFSFTPGVSRSVYLEEIEPAAFLPNDINSFRQTVFEQMWTALDRYRK
jgi:1-acyl-sn-glycerol-3-phosphate acyltransferase